MNGRDLRIITAAAVPILRVLDDTGVAIELVLEIVSNAMTCSTYSSQTYTTVDLVEQRRPKGCNDSEKQHGRSDSGRLNIKPLRLALDCSKAHRETREEEDTGKNASDDTAFY